ncbi:MAG: hypothetical protein KAJ06_07325 [Gammaproteobacteria bacterium]|nr:hypothetical protein [Gammaproteobacteria bacterium]
MKLLFNLDVIEGNRVKARPSDYLRSLPADRQQTEVQEFLQWAENAAQNDPDQKARAEAEIGVATAREFLDKLQNAAPRIYTGGKDGHD